ncbi:MAG TPA: hypothetical protein VJV79_16830 [Polyangiaceae bacterium]|nr:hypothetical protein [Polyangiaceae bacterium]
MGCGTSARNFKAAGAGAGGQAENNNGAGSGNTAGERGGAGGSGPSQGGDAGAAGAESDAAAAGMAGAPDEPADLCVGKVCDSPPAAECKDASTRTTYASSGTCSAGQCSYAPTITGCVGDTPKCKESGSGSQCVTCLADADCSNDGICNSVNACVCSARFNGKRCEFQVFRGLGKLQGDWHSREAKISHDGSVVVGVSVPMTGSSRHMFRSVNGGELQFIANPQGATGNCGPVGIDSTGNVLLSCEGAHFLYSPGGISTPVDTPASGNFLDISWDGRVLVGSAYPHAVRKVGAAATLLGPFLPGGSTQLLGTNGDGSVAVGYHNSSGNTPIRWTATTGLVALPVLSAWVYSIASDVSTDGKVIVGSASLESDILYGQVAVKWSGASHSPTLLGGGPMFGSAAAVNLDGSVIVGSQSNPSVAMLWNDTGGHTVKSLLSSTPDLTSDWTLESATGVSDDGKFVVGVGAHGSIGEAWIVHLP